MREGRPACFRGLDPLSALCDFLDEKPGSPGRWLALQLVAARASRQLLPRFFALAVAFVHVGSGIGGDKVSQ